MAAVEKVKKKGKGKGPAPAVKQSAKGTLVQPTSSGGCFTNISRALQDILSKFVYCRNRTSCENFKLKLCKCAQSHALGTCTKFQLEILTTNVISGMAYFRKIILESSRNVSETTPWLSENVAAIHRWHFETMLFIYKSSWGYSKITQSKLFFYRWCKRCSLKSSQNQF